MVKGRAVATIRTTARPTEGRERRILYHSAHYSGSRRLTRSTPTYQPPDVPASVVSGDVLLDRYLLHRPAMNTERLVLPLHHSVVDVTEPVP